MKSAEIRQAFLDYFKSQGHEVVTSSSLVPANDPTLLFTNAGMVQFKETFLGEDKPLYNRATSSQRCVRAGGKHNDLENVGYTARHHTFFEMLGNFSFGDYFKKEAIEYAWDFLTNILRIPEKKLWITVYTDDDEAAEIWLKHIGVDPKRFSRCGEKDNFWSMGDTGPCGPCSEIFYDHGEEVAGGPPGSPEQEGDRYVEIWNLVFMQFNRDAEGKLAALPHPSVDTGMGLERLAAVLQGVKSNYDIDLFQALIQKAAELTHTDELNHPSLKVIADHIRSSAFLILDTVVPSNEGRGYVLRRIIRRALRHGNKLGTSHHFFFKLVDVLVDEMGGAYSELAKNADYIKEVIQQEEAQFSKTLEQGLSILEEAISQLKGQQIPGALLFKLYDTYGFPVDLIGDIAREKGLELDEAGFEAEMEKQRARARKSSQFKQNLDIKLKVDEISYFCGYEKTETNAKLIAILSENKNKNTLSEGQEGILILDNSPFYAESGGQSGDTGQLLVGGACFQVDDTQKKQAAILHIGRVISGEFKLGQSLTASVDRERRRKIMLNHSATHLLHAALRQILGSHVQQKGSLVEADRLRFDFSHSKPLSDGELNTIESLVNEKIRANFKVKTDIMSPDEAQSKGAVALFGEKYGDKVRVLAMGDFSVELCGGTHVQQTGDIGYFKLTGETGIASGVRRIEAICGQAAVEAARTSEASLKTLAALLKTSPEDMVQKSQQLVEQLRGLEKEVDKLRGQLAGAAGQKLVDQAEVVEGIKVLAVSLEDVDPKSLRDSADQLKNKLGRAVVVLAAVKGSKISLVASSTKDCSNQIHAGNLVKFVAEQLGGKGGGRSDMGQGGGQNPDALPAALSSVKHWVEAQLTST